MMKLSEMINISKVNEKKLEDAGIDSAEELKKVGSKKAFLMVRGSSDPGACLSMLQGLEGAIQGVRWHNLPEGTKEDLKKFYKEIND